MIVDVEVTQEDIKRGHRHKCQSCPVARALHRAIDDRSLWTVYVDAKHIDGILTAYALAFVTGSGEPGIRLNLPEEAANFISNFDAGREVHPFSFDVNAPDSLLARIKAATEAPTNG